MRGVSSVTPYSDMLAPLTLACSIRKWTGLSAGSSSVSGSPTSAAAPAVEKLLRLQVHVEDFIAAADDQHRVGQRVENAGRVDFLPHRFPQKGCRRTRHQAAILSITGE